MDKIIILQQFRIPKEQIDNIFSFYTDTLMYIRMNYLSPLYYVKYLSNYFYHCARNGLVEQYIFLEKLNKHHCDHLIDLNVACIGGHLDMVKYLVTTKQIKESISICFAASNGHLHIVKYLYERNQEEPDLPVLILKSSVREGHRNIVEWICSTVLIPIQQEILDDVICSKDEDFFFWYINFRKDYASPSCLDKAKSFNMMKVHKYLNQNWHKMIVYP